MCRIADLHSGEDRADDCGAFISVDATRPMPYTLRAIDVEDETIAELQMIVGFDDDLADDASRISNRLRSLPARIHPSP